MISTPRQEYWQAYYKANKDKILTKNRLWAKTEIGKQKGNKYRLKMRKLVLDHYGNICICCGEAHYEFLGIDHINGGGHQHKRDNNIKGDMFYRWIVKNNFPKEFQILCHNCNLAKGFYGQCPHSLN